MLISCFQLRFVVFICAAFFLVFSTFENSAQAADKKKDKVYFVRGNFIDFHSKIHQKAEKALFRLMRDRFWYVDYKSVHNHRWEQVCEDLIQLDRKKKLGRVILLGHSWGAQVSWAIARCVQEKVFRSLDLVVAMDPVQKPFHPDVRVVPFNVKNVFAVSQPDGFWFQRGVQGLMRPDGSRRGIELRLLDFNEHPKAHDLVFFELVQDRTLEDLISYTLSSPW
jgi:hypothetical protein